MGKVFFRFCFLALFTVPFIVGSCDTDDYVIEANGIQSDSVTIYIDHTGRANSLTVSTFKEWWLELEHPSQASWLTVTPDGGDYTDKVTLTASTNTWRRRSTRIIFHNAYMADTVTVIQRANEYYEPGTVLYNENFGTDTVTTRTAIADFTAWGANGRGVSVIDYTGSRAFIVADPMFWLAHYMKQPHEEISSANTLELEPNGIIELPRLNKSGIDSVILTLYAASYDRNGFLPMETGALYVEGSTDNTDFTRLPFSVSATTGWQKIESEFRIQTSASNFFMRIGNSGSQSVYIDDVTLEAGGRGTQTIGRPTPIVTTLAATEITAVSAELRGSYTLPLGISSVDRAGIRWRPANEQNYTEVDIAGHQPGEDFTLELSGLEPGETYNFQAYTVHNGDIVTYGNSLSFTTNEAGSGR